MDDMIERIARVLAKAYHEQFAIAAGEYERDPDDWRKFLPMACAVWDEIAEPTQAMQNAGSVARYYNKQDCSGIWRAMNESERHDCPAVREHTGKILDKAMKEE